MVVIMATLILIHQGSLQGFMQFLRSCPVGHCCLQTPSIPNPSELVKSFFLLVNSGQSVPAVDPVAMNGHKVLCFEQLGFLQSFVQTLGFHGDRHQNIQFCLNVVILQYFCHFISPNLLNLKELLCPKRG